MRGMERCSARAGEARAGEDRHEAARAAGPGDEERERQRRGEQARALRRREAPAYAQRSEHPMDLWRDKEEVGRYGV